MSAAGKNSVATTASNKSTSASVGSSSPPPNYVDATTAGALMTDGAGGATAPLAEKVTVVASSNHPLQQQQTAYLLVMPGQQTVATNAVAPTLVPVAMPGSYMTTMMPSSEPPEAAVARPLSVLSLFCWFNVLFSIPAIVLAYRRNKSRSNYNASIGLSLTAIVLGLAGAFTIMMFGLFMPFEYYRGNYYSSSSSNYNSQVDRSSESFYNSNYYNNRHKYNNYW